MLLLLYIRVNKEGKGSSVVIGEPYNLLLGLPDKQSTNVRFHINNSMPPKQSTAGAYVRRAYDIMPVADGSIELYSL